jgi:hypothetical protein
MAAVGLRDVLAQRDFRRYAFARFLATITWQMLAVAVGWQVYDITRDPLDLGLIGLAQFLPFLALVLPGGQLADRIDRRRVLLIAYLADDLAGVPGDGLGGCWTSVLDAGRSSDGREPRPDRTVPARGRVQCDLVPVCDGHRPSDRRRPLCTGGIDEPCTG